MPVRYGASWRAQTLVTLLLAAACSKPAAAPPKAQALHFDEALWKPPLEADIPNDSLGKSIKRGLYLMRFTPESLPKYVTSGLRCTSCHQVDGLKASAAPLTGAAARFPKYMPRSGAVIALADRVNYCFTRSLAGHAIPTGSREMVDILAYITFISKDVPVGAHIAGTDGLISMKDTLVGDTLRGRTKFEATCVVCHQKDGSGNGPIPPLWGNRSYSIGASMAREERAASFIWHNMPQTAPGTLTPQEAFDLSAYINSHARPDSPGKEGDWPTGGAPPDVPYATKGHQPHRPPATLIPRPVEGSLVPNPPSVLTGSDKK
ncbi:MAG: c-type cytochrome [Gemmatimonadetes bacterium]|nr:c-type cytochrome [Gemmatimonadota bacterium]MBI3567097.1 c-type cytochrome [Gemmatimonadota bacterium]